MFTSHPSLLVLLSLLLVLSPSVHVKGQQDSSVKCEPLLPELVRKTKTGGAFRFLIPPFLFVLFLLVID